MKRIFTLFSLVVLVSSFVLLAGIGEVIAAFKTGSASQVARYFDANVEISLPGKSNTYSKSQAELVLQDFFSLNPIKGFEVIHKGGNAGSEYCIGTLQTRNGNFRTTLYMKQKDGVQVLQEIGLEGK